MPHRYIYRRIRYGWYRTKRFIKYRVLHVDDTPHRIALGVAIGCFLAWTPTIGLQMVLVVLLAAMLRANKLVGVPFVWISNPLTIIPIYYPNYWLGCKLSGSTAMRTPQAWREMISPIFNESLGWWGAMRELLKLSMEIAVPLWIGSVLIGLFVGGMAYWATYTGVVQYRKRFAHLHMKFLARAARAIKAKVSHGDAES